MSKAHAFSADVEVASFQLREHLQKLLEEAGDLRCQLVVVGDVRHASGETGLPHNENTPGREVAAHTPTGCSTQRTLLKFVQLQGFLFKIR